MIPQCASQPSIYTTRTTSTGKAVAARHVQTCLTQIDVGRVCAGDRDALTESLDDLNACNAHSLQNECWHGRVHGDWNRQRHIEHANSLHAAA